MPLVEERCAKVDHWQNSEPTPPLARDRALGASSRACEKVMGYRHLLPNFVKHYS